MEELDDHPTEMQIKNKGRDKTVVLTTNPIELMSQLLYELEMTED